MIGLFCCAICLFLQTVTLAQQGTVSLRLDEPSESIRPGEVFGMTLIRSWPDGYMPASFESDALRPIEVLDVTREDGLSEGAEVLRLRCILMRSGEIVIPPIRFTAMPNTAGRQFVVFSKALAFSVAGLIDPAAPGEMESLQPINDGLASVASLLRILLLIITVGSGVWLVVRWARLSKLRRLNGTRCSPALAACREMEVLNAESIPFEDWCDGASRICRRYFSARFGIEATTATVNEVEMLLSDPSINDGGLTAAVLALLHLTDAARFSGKLPSDEALDEFSATWKEAIASLEASRSES